MRLRARARFVLFAWLMLAAARSSAGEGSLVITEENDIFCGCGLDRHYTQGLSATLETSRAPRRVRWTLGQTIYTPADLSRSDLIYGDRPYSGWLWFGPEFVREDGSRQLTARLYAGATGEASFAEQAQRWVHRVIGAQDPKGWEHQLRAQVGANLFLDGQQRLWLHRRGGWRDADVVPRASVAVGNMFDHLEGGAQLRFGRLAGASLAEPPLPSYREGEGVEASALEPLEVYILTTVSGRAVAYDYSLQGDGARERFGIRPLMFVGTWEAGLGLSLWRAALEFRWIVRSPDFSPAREPQGFGSLRLTVRG